MLRNTLFYTAEYLILNIVLSLGVAVWIKLADSGPVFYRGVRVGRFGKTFQMMKFRTMVVNAEKLGPSSTTEEDARITAPGRFLRRIMPCLGCRALIDEVGELG